MRKLLILLMSLPILATAQLKTPNNYEDHAVAGALIGFTVHTIGYRILSEKTKLHPVWCKVIAGVASIAVSNYAGMAYENYSGGVYSKDDIKYTSYGGLAGTALGFAITFNSWPNRYKDKKLVEL